MQENRDSQDAYLNLVCQVAQCLEHTPDLITAHYFRNLLETSLIEPKDTTEPKDTDSSLDQLRSEVDSVSLENPDHAYQVKHFREALSILIRLDDSPQDIVAFLRAAFDVIQAIHEKHPDLIKTYLQTKSRLGQRG